MFFVALVFMGTQAVISLVVGFKLMRLARETRRLPELTLGLATLSLPALGFPSAVATLGLEALELPGVPAILFVAVSGMTFAAVMYFVFTWQVFRPRERWALVLCGVGAWMLAAPIGGITTHVDALGVDAGIREARVWTLTVAGAVFVAFAWTGLESFRYFAILRRRLRLGLVEPVVCNRFLLWSLLSVAWILSISAAILVLVLGLNPLSHEPFMLCLGLSGLANSIFMSLCFMPPKSYLAWVERRAAALQES